MSLPAGALRHRVTLETVISELDSEGAMIETWFDAVGQMLSAEIVPLSGRELIAAQAVQSVVNTRIRIRYRPGVVARMRVRHRSTIYNIHAVVPDPVSGGRYLTLLASSGINEG